MLRLDRPKPWVRTAKRLAAVSVLIALAGCTHEPSAPATTLRASLNNPLYPGYEGELFGNIWVNGEVTQDPGYYVDLEPFNQATANRLWYYNPTTWADTGVASGSARWMFEWTDPKAGGNCGNLATYVAGDTTTPSGQGGRYAEIHPPAPNVSPAGVEKHCIRPGHYLLTITHGGEAVRQLRVDYLPIVPSSSGANTPKLIWNATAQRSEHLEGLDYDDTTSL